jgi:octaheme c-type cytochrome (tetrathionate reductase family)
LFSFDSVYSNVKLELSLSRMKTPGDPQIWILSSILIATAALLALMQLMYTPPEPNLALEALRVKHTKPYVPSVDHTKFEQLKGPFASPQAVTQTCLTCHTESHKEVMASSHWNWDRISYIEGRGVAAIGKKNVLNNYCIGVAGNELACASCHTGFGLKSIQDFDFKRAENVDCMSCHDHSGQYNKGTSMAGIPGKDVDLVKAALSVGKPAIENCGSCHFYGGGGNNVKHGDLEESLYAATKDLDVHLAKEGVALSCVSCHTAENHVIKGRLYSVSSANINRSECSDCHSETPHLTEILNTHTARVACQTCHIPVYAKANPTKMEWKWSDAGQLNDGLPFTKEDPHGEHAYMSQKGSFVWASNVAPEYVWFNGNADHYLLGDRIDTTALPVKINTMLGSHNDPASKIIPVKVHRGDQIYDAKYLTLIQPKLYAVAAGDSAFWKDFNWRNAAQKGMADIGLPFSGEYGFVKTEMYWPINHMVSPASQSLTCGDCHTQRSDGRLAALTGFYLPGRDRNSTLDSFGLGMVLLAIFGVVVHGGARVWLHLRNTKDLEMPHAMEKNND